LPDNDCNGGRGWILSGAVDNVSSERDDEDTNDDDDDCNGIGASAPGEE
jgi:hypothetical protein